MEDIVIEILEDFIISQTYSEYIAFAGEEDTDAQDLTIYFKYLNHINLCKKGIKACKDFLKTKNVLELIHKFNMLGLYNNVEIIRNNVRCNK